MIPKTLKNFNVFINGTSYVGEAEEVTLPKLTRKTEEFRGGGMSGPVEIDLGQEKMEMEISFKGWNKEVIKQYGGFAADGVVLRFRGSVRSDDSTATTSAVQVTAKGRFKEMDFGSAKAGELNSMKIMFPITAFKYESDGTDLLEIDVLNMIFVVDGDDKLKEERIALGIN